MKLVVWYVLSDTTRLPYQRAPARPFEEKELL